MVLHALDQIREGHGDAAEQEHGRAIFGPAHLTGLIHAREPVHQLLDRPQHRVQERLLAVEHTRHERAQGFGQCQHHEKKE